MTTLKPTERNSRSTCIGVISDTHGLLRPQALELLRGVDYLIHAGDVGDPNILDTLRNIAPLAVVRGNVDKGTWANELPPSDVLEVNGLLIYVLHNIEDLDLDAQAAGFTAVIYGHSHIAEQEVRSGVLFFNPGSAGPRRFKLPITVGRLLLQNGAIRGEILSVPI
jgi:uncharacterized protein